jgi:chemotaxis protein CheD
VKHIVDISDAKISTQPEDTIITYSLGSCIGVSVYDPISKIGGMLHYQLPSSKQDGKGAPIKNPLMYADTGMEILLKKMFSLGAEKKRMKIKIAGGSQMLDDNDFFKIGKRNYTMIRQLLWKNGMFIDGEDVGGSIPRTLLLTIQDGTVTVKSKGQEKTI